MGTYGNFTDDGLEYVVNTPHTPREWFNFYWNQTYLASGGPSLNGSSLFQNDKGVVTNLFGKQDMREEPRWVYIRDNAAGQFWSGGFQPCLQELDEYQMRHGLGYSILRTLKNGIRVEFRLFVPRNFSGEVWTITVTNESRKTRDLSIFPVANIILDGVIMPYGYLGGLDACFVPKGNYLFFRNRTHTVVEEKYRAFMYTDAKVHAWDVSKDHFLGKYKNYARPEAIEQGRLRNSVASAEYLVGALQHNVKLKPKASKTIQVVLGVVLDEKEARGMIRAFATPKKIEAEVAAIRKQNVARLGGLTVNTPDGDFNRLFSVWLKHQLYLMADWARFYFKGYRDTCQDAAGMSIINPGRATEMFHKALRWQRSDGFAPRAFRIARKGQAGEGKQYADSPSWISHTTDAILSETGDLALLDQVLPYSDQGEGTVWEHNLKAMEFLWADRGQHGLSLVHDGDWNDLMDKVGSQGRGESVWMSFALARVLKIVGKIAGWKGDAAVAALCQTRFDELRKNILAHGWDGDHFIYSINDEGLRIGTKESKEGRYFINPQSWALLSGVLNADEYTKIAQVIEPIVDTPVGPVHNWPPFTKYNPGIGQLTGTPPGFVTNGNVYCHAAGFKVAADFEAGRADKAFDTLRRILPSEDKSEPYAQCAGYVGPSALRVTRHVSDEGWRTGTVGWHFLNCIDRLLGFRRTLGGFNLRPLLPAKWNTVSYVRPFRGTDFAITIERHGAPGITVDGQPLAGDFIAVPHTGYGKRKVRILCRIV